MIEFSDRGAEGEVWTALLELATGFAGTWCLIGARMVEVHGRLRGRTPPRLSADLDTLCDARTVGSRPVDLADWLRARGFLNAGVSPEGIGHRFHRGVVSIDILAPDHLGARADLRVGDGARTIAVPGGRRALRSTITVAARCGDQAADVPIPSLAGALLAKTRAVTVDDVPASQRQDLAFLYSLVDDVQAVAADLSARDRRSLSRRRELLDRDHDAWRAVGPNGQNGYDAFRFLARP